MRILLILFCCAGPILLWSTPSQVIIIRHAEKPPEGAILSLKGRERAAALVPFFLGNPVVLQFGPPIAIYAMRPSAHHDSLRPVQTVEGISQALFISLNTQYEHNSHLRMAEEILAKKEYEGKMVLICWPHQDIPEIAKALGARTVPDHWPGHVFDRLWIINYRRGDTQFQDISQRLMYGDSDN